MSTAGVRLINLMGSHGTKAVAAALMGASVTCVDISPSNTQYGQQLAAAAGVDVAFLVTDVLELPEEEHQGGWLGSGMQLMVQMC
jgi:23S rRNA G2069 N7-methylase RlmK/C1962 C5-methylase RlmI